MNEYTIKAFTSKEVFKIDLYRNEQVPSGTYFVVLPQDKKVYELTSDEISTLANFVKGLMDLTYMDEGRTTDIIETMFETILGKEVWDVEIPR